MELKTTHALLLSIVVMTGAMTTDAFAQSNTERLAEIDEKSDTIQSIVDGLERMMESLSDNVQSILSKITSMVGKLGNVDASVAGIRDAVIDLSTQTNSLETSARGMDANMADVQEKVGSLSSAITSFNDMQTNVVLLTAKIDNLEAILAADDIINDITTNANNIDALSEQVTATDARMMATLNEIQGRLVDITANLSVVSDKVGRPVVQSGSTADAFTENSEDKRVSTYDFARLGKKTDERGYTYYDLDLRFVCNEDVRLKTATVIQALTEGSQYLNRGAVYDSTTTESNPRPFPATANYPDLGVNYVKIQGTSIYHNWYQINPTNVVEFSYEADFGTRLLRAGDTVPFHARLYDGEFVISNDTSTLTTIDADTAGRGGTVNVTDIGDYVDKILEDDYTVYRNTTSIDDGVVIHPDFRVQLIERDGTTAKDLYTIRVDWISTKSGTQCHLSFGSEGNIATYDKRIEHVFTAHVVNPEDVLSNFDTTLDCAGDPARISNIEAIPAPSDKWDEQFENYAKLYLTVQDGKDDDTPDAEYLFAVDGEVTLLEGDDYLEFRDADLRIHGELPPYIEDLIIRFDIDTIQNAVCTNKATS